jgi:hypothetical protein
VSARPTAIESLLPDGEIERIPVAPARPWPAPEETRMHESSETQPAEPGEMVIGWRVDIDRVSIDVVRERPRLLARDADAAGEGGAP